MKIDSHQVTFRTTHSKFASTSLTQNYFNFQDNLENNKIDSLKNGNSSFKNMSSEYIISELTRAIMNNLFILQKRTKMFGAKFYVSKSEYETMSFQTKATIQTSSSSINVDISLTMQRSFTKQLELNSFHAQGLFADPLIISLDDTMPTLSEKSFHFDIDSDGESEQISLLGKNSAFLALDKDKNGFINSADELFGAKSGNGFEDLKLYDEDKNGWIDENDTIFHKLRIWKKSEHEDKLLVLGEVGIGAIYLGNARTPFEINTTHTNTALGKMQRSSFFLRDNGKSGLISQIDLAILQDDKHALKDVLALVSDEKSVATDKTKEQKSIFKLLMEHIKQMEVELIKANPKEKLSIEEKLILLKKKLKNMRV